METQKIVNLLNGSDNENSKFATKKWYVIDSESKGNYSHENPIKFLTSSLESNLCDYSDAYILVTGNITVVGADDNTKVAFKNCAPFRKCRTAINEMKQNILTLQCLCIIWLNTVIIILILQKVCGSLKRDKIIVNINLTNNNSSSFKYKPNLIGNTVADGANRKQESVKIVVPLKYLSNFSRSLEMPLINCKVEFSLRWNENCVLSNVAGNSIFTITDAKLYGPIVILSAKDNAKFSKSLTEGFKKLVY